MYIPENVSDEAPSMLLPKGIYNFHVSNAEDTTSKSGNEMIKLTLKVFDTKGKAHTVWDYLIDLESQWYKSKHFLQTCGMTYEKVDLKSVNCLGKSGKVIIDIQKDKDGKYPDKNVVRDYAKPDHLVEKSLSSEAFTDDEIPF